MGTIKNDGDVGKVDALCVIESGIAAGKESRITLALALDHSNPGWRENEKVVARIQEIGVDAALRGMHERLLAEAAA